MRSRRQVQRWKSQHFAAGFYEEKPRGESPKTKPDTSTKMKGRSGVH
jgi:hypothetical protein